MKTNKGNAADYALMESFKSLRRLTNTLEFMCDTGLSMTDDVFKNLAEEAQVFAADIVNRLKHVKHTETEMPLLRNHSWYLEDLDEDE